MQGGVPFTLAKGIGVLRLMALFFWLCALLAAGWQAYDRDTVRRTWPETEAEVTACRVARADRRDAQPRHRRAGPHRGDAALGAPPSAGSRQAIRYDPVDPRGISLGDADAEFEPDTVDHRLQLALLFGAAGVMMFGVGLWLAAIKQRRDASSG